MAGDLNTKVTISLVDELSGKLDKINTALENIKTTCAPLESAFKASLPPPILWA